MLLEQYQMKLKILILFILLSNSHVSNAIQWNAEWIWAKQRTGEPNTWLATRKNIDLDTVPQEFIAHVSADTKYWLWINGVLVVFEGSYTGGPSPVKASPRVDNFPIASNKYYDSVDIAPFLKEGNNTIAALVWYYGHNGDKGTHISSKKAGFIFQAKAGGTQIKTDKSWKVKRHKAYQSDVKKPYPYRIAAWGINYDARLDIQDWTNKSWYKPGYDDSDWDNATSMHRPPRAPFFNLYPSEIPILTDYGLADCTNFTSNSFPFVSDGKPIKCVLEFNKNVTPYFDIDAQPGLNVHIDSNMRLNTIETNYITKAGRQQFESYTWFNARNIIFNIPEGVKVHALKYRWTGIGDTPGHFEADDSWYTRIWQMAENTLYVCARDNFMDTPDRERGLWIGDVADQASYLFYSMDQAGRDLLKKSIKVTLAFSDTESGIFAGLAPGRFRELPAQSLQFIDQGIWHYYYNTGDLNTLAYAYPYVHRYLELWEMKPNGLPIFRNGAWKWTDWGPQETVDYDVIQNALYYSALLAARNMAITLNDNNHIDFYNNRINSIETSFQDEYWQNGFFSSDPEKFKDDRANAISIIYGLANKSQYKDIVNNVLVPINNASPHFEWMVYNAMAIAEGYDELLFRMKKRYGKQVNNSQLSTLAEYLPSGGTENHAWNAPSTVLSKYIVGMSPTDVAWKSFEVLPNMAHMKHLKQLVPSVQGNINFEITRTKFDVQMHLSVPHGVTAVIGVPKQYFDINTVNINENLIWNEGNFKKINKNINFHSENEKYLKFTLKAGDYKLLAEK